jgi:Zn-dependent protease with chaperone function
MKNLNLYPPTPLNTDASVIKPSASFKKSVLDVVIAMLIFIIVYLMLFIGALAIATAFGAIGIWIIAAKPTFITLILGLGLIISGLLLVYFLIKFAFKQQSIDYSNMVEVTVDDQPALFEFIHRLTEETKSPSPKKIFLTADVNAAVFYNSTFWSMLFPVRKNLQIGLGMVNCLNISEFKAVMAHEFGHFSQRSMKFGSYVYNMNRVIHNVLFDNEGYQETLNTVGQMHGLVQLCISINIFLIKGIQGILKVVYVFVNKKYLRLSREMEFHADAIAAYVAGSNQGVKCLRKAELAGICFNDLYNFLNKLSEDKQRIDNIYPYHIETIKLLAREQRLATDGNGFPTLEKLPSFFDNTRVVVKDQWSSHPSNKDREAHLTALGLITPTITDSAWELFNDPENLQKHLTDMVYSTAPEKYEIIDHITARDKYIDLNKNNSYNPIYGGFYNGRYLNSFDVDEAIKTLPQQSIDFDDLFNDENCNVPAAITGVKNDIATIEAIVTSNEIKTFDYQGIKYKKADAGDIKMILEGELQTIEDKLKTLDKLAFQFFYSRSSDPDKLANQYNQLFFCQQKTEEYLELYGKLLENINPIFSTMKFEDIEKAVSLIYEREKDFKPILQLFTTEEKYKKLMVADDLKSLNAYLSQNLIYFNHPDYNEHAVQMLTRSVNTYYVTVINYFFVVKKNLTDEQLINAGVATEEAGYIA